MAALQDACAEPTGLLTPSASPTADSARPLILVADDDPISLELVSTILDSAGYRVALAEDGDAALRAFDSIAPDLLLLDCQMPGRSGLEVCRAIKSDQNYAELPIIFLTALSDGRDKARGFEEGAVDYITKPIEPLELLARIRTHLDLATARAAMARKLNLYETITEQQTGRLAEIRAGQELLLSSPDEFPGLKLAVEFLPAHEAGGDFYEVVQLSENEYGLLVTDVSGHDLSVPFVTGALKALARTFMKDALSPIETLTMIDASLRSLLREDRYVTGVYARLNLEEMTVELVSGGHPPALHVKRGGVANWISIAGDVLGMHDRVVFESQFVQLEPGDRLYLYTDGLIEGCPDSQGRLGRPLHGMKCLHSIVGHHAGVDIREAVKAIVRDVRTGAGGALADDVILMGLEF